MSDDHDGCIDFLRRLIRTPSLPGHEGDLAREVEREMNALGYPEVRIDAVGNVLGRIPGGDGPAVMFNTHLDHVDVGDPDRWPFPPFAAHTDSEHVWG
ncbi:MAG: acetylornithine deacetylase/succinyldiaminopimelate desuccinylase-like deacylase, partial [Acidobacteriota bacterium]|nr:acetylornithine deacetylase/succinyldiaminopimelate desuccinylase-like deacylase [Acidobacteriota bacterium]